MAAPHVSRSTSNIASLNESINGSALGKPYRLPNGQCNFTNLAVGGATPPRCGCQRFWDRLEYNQSIDGKQLDAGIRERGGFCMCSHHACYHDLLPTRSSLSQQVGTSGALRVSSQHSGRGEPSFTSRLQSQNTDRHTSQPRQASVSNETYSARVPDDKKTYSQIKQPLIGSDLPGIGSRQSDAVALGLPPIPSQCYLPPDVSSGGVSGHSQSFQSFPGRTLNLLEEKSSGQNTPPSDLADQYITLPFPLFTPDQLLPSGYGEGESFVQSATEVRTPSPCPTPGLSVEQKLEHHIASVQAALDISIPGSSRARNFQTCEQNDRKCSVQRDIIGNSEAHTKFSAEQTDLSKPNDERALSGQDQSCLTAIAKGSTVDIANSTAIDSHDNGLPLPRAASFHLQAILRHVSAHPTLNTRVQNHEQRIDLLENVSCSYASAQETHEGFELVDERIGEVESRVEELEKAQAVLHDFSGGTSFRRRMTHLEDGDNSMASQTSSELISAAIERTEFSSRLDTLESQFTEFRSLTSPSCINPWQVEVVFLPFGPSLKGIWSAADELQTQKFGNNSVAGESGAQSQFSCAVARRPLRGLDTGRRCWENLHLGSDRNAELFVARACGQQSKVVERLRSRGLVRTIEVMGPDARDVQAAMLAAFNDLPKTLCIKGTHQQQQVPTSMACFHGLRESWIPLRKLHKDSRLRFLDPAEMVTPALWTMSFLSSSVIMRATGVKRLYVTQSESYIQQEKAAAGHWTWQKLRLLPRVFPDNESSAEVREADAREACWEWDERLDPSQSHQTSFTSQQSSQHSSLSIRVPPSERSRTSKSDQSSSPAASPVVSTTATSVTRPRQISPLIGRIRPLHSRTTSMPLISPLKISPPPSKRRITSFDHEPPRSTSPQSSPVRAPLGLSIKRARISRSPSRPRDTPRWSVGPPSPYGLEEAVEQKRGTTPFAYATPHSNAPYTDFRSHSVTGMAVYDQYENGSITEELGLDEEHDLDDFNSAQDQGPCPEDEDWKGIRDEVYDDGSDQEQKALSSEDDSDEGMSELSSQPSEYPSTQPTAFEANNKGAFRIRADDDEEYDAFNRPQTS